MGTSNDVYIKAIKVAGLQINSQGEVSLVGDAKNVLSHLVEQYEHFFGRASIEVCKDALRQVNPHLPSEDLPEILK
jgi:hypothetical protein